MDLGFPEILALVVLALLLFGPTKLPQLGRSMGEAIRGFKKGLSGNDDKPETPPQSQSVQNQIHYNQESETSQSRQTERTNKS